MVSREDSAAHCRLLRNLLVRSFWGLEGPLHFHFCWLACCVVPAPLKEEAMRRLGLGGVGIHSEVVGEPPKLLQVHAYIPKYWVVSLDRHRYDESKDRYIHSAVSARWLLFQAVSSSPPTASGSWCCRSHHLRDLPLILLDQSPTNARIPSGPGLKTMSAVRSAVCEMATY